MTRRALITGISGQDGSLLAELLLELGYEVCGIVRGSGPYPNLEGILHRVELHEVDLLDERSVVRCLERSQPHEIYNLASVSFAPASWDDPVLTAQVGTVGVTVLLEAVRHVDPTIRYCQASSSEIFGQPQETPQTERTPLSPLTPYGAAKVYGHVLGRSYRRRFGVFACSGILYNHESERRPLHFLPRKVAHGAAAIALGLEREISLGDLYPRRDWGYARDYVRAMWLMLQHSEPTDYIVATGTAHSVEELVACAFERVALDWRKFVRIETSLQRGNAELFDVVGDASKARERLGWSPTLTFEELVHHLVDSELERLRAKSATMEVS